MFIQAFTTNKRSEETKVADKALADNRRKAMFFHASGFSFNTEIDQLELQ